MILRPTAQHHGPTAAPIHQAPAGNCWAISLDAAVKAGRGMSRFRCGHRHLRFLPASPSTCSPFRRAPLSYPVRRPFYPVTWQLRPVRSAPYGAGTLLEWRPVGAAAPPLNEPKRKKPHPNLKTPQTQTRHLKLPALIVHPRRKIACQMRLLKRFLNPALNSAPL